MALRKTNSIYKYLKSKYKTSILGSYLATGMQQDEEAVTKQKINTNN